MVPGPRYSSQLMRDKSTMIGRLQGACGKDVVPRQESSKICKITESNFKIGLATVVVVNGCGRVRSISPSFSIRPCGREIVALRQTRFGAGKNAGTVGICSATDAWWNAFESRCNDGLAASVVTSSTPVQYTLQFVTVPGPCTAPYHHQGKRNRMNIRTECLWIDEFICFCCH